MNAALTSRYADARRDELLAARERTRAGTPRRAARRRALVLAALLPAALAAAPAADAATVSVAGSSIVVAESRPNEVNRIVVRPSGADRIIVSDAAGELGGGTGCRVFNGDIECPTPKFVHVAAGDGADRVEYRVPTAGLVQLGEGNDQLVAGVRERVAATEDVVYSAGGGHDVIYYTGADQGVSVDMADRVAQDGRPGDRENVLDDFEFLYGSEHRDILFGTPGPDSIAGLGERDVIAGGAGDDMFYSPLRDGADDYHGGPDSDTIVYIGRKQPLNVTLDNATNDGETGEFDLVRSNVENIAGGEAADTLNSFSAFSRLEGFGGADTLIGGDGADTLIGGDGPDSLNAGAGTDIVEAQDGTADSVDCGTESDTLARDSVEGVVKGCEKAAVGELRLIDRTITAKDGTATVELRWRHPRAWRSLKSVTLRVVDGGVPVGTVTIDPAGQRVSADGAVTVAGKARVSRQGKDVTAKVTLNVDETTAKTLAVEVEAADKNGRRQLVRRAGSIAVN